MNLVVSIITPLLIPDKAKPDPENPDDKKGDDANTIAYIFLSCAVLTAFCTVFVAIFMIETKGKTYLEIEKLNYVEKQWTKKKV